MPVEVVEKSGSRIAAAVANAAVEPRCTTGGTADDVEALSALGSGWPMVNDPWGTSLPFRPRESVSRVA